MPDQSPDHTPDQTPDQTPNRQPNGLPRPMRAQPPLDGRTRILDAPTIRSFDGPFGSMHLLEAAVDQANLDARRLEHLLIAGPAGSGKLVLARAVVRDLAQRATEVDGETLESLPHLMDVVRALRTRDVLLVRHLDLMHKRGQLHLAALAGERRTPRAAREPREPWLKRDPDEAPTPVPNFTLLATATDATKVLPVLRQHFELTLHLGAPNAQGQRTAIRRGLAALAHTAEPHALERIVELALAQPDCTEALVRVVGIRARAEGHAYVTRELVERCAAFDVPLLLPHTGGPASPGAAA